MFARAVHVVDCPAGNARTHTALVKTRGPSTLDLMAELWVERTGSRRYTGKSSRGAEVLIGSEDVEGAFTPGELLKIALAACTGMRSDVPLARRLGDDYDATVRVSGDADRENERYPQLDEVLELDMSELDPEARTRLLSVVERAVDKVCTVGRTLKAGTTVTLKIDAES